MLANQSLARPASPRSTILVVDDDRDTLLLTERLLRQVSFDVITATSGPEALLLAQEHRPALILLDVTMPGMDGYEVCAHLQDDPGTACVPVIFVTARNEERDKARAFAVGGADYLVKPLGKASLLETVQRHVETRSRWYQVQTAADLWDEAALPQKFVEFRDLLVKRLGLGAELARELSEIRSGDVYDITRLVDISEEDLAKQMADFFGAPFVANLDPDSIQLGVLPTAFCRTNHVVAVREPTGDEAFVISNPFRWGLDELDFLTRASRGRPRRLRITDRRTMASLFVDGGVGSKPGSTAAPQVEVVAEASVSFDRILQDAHNASAVQIVNALIADAVRRGASDLHIQPSRSMVRVRYRVDGEMGSVMPLDLAQLRGIVARIKIMCGMDIAETRAPQDGQCTVSVDGQEVELRASTLPATHGEKVVLRVLGHRVGLQRLESLGFSAEMLSDLRRLLATRQGMLLITGPTGSGKTTVLYAALSYLNTDQMNIVTVEDPVEMDLDGITQVQVNDRAGRTFAATLRAMLRQDPDVIMVGEIRDVETAEIACRAALTGHLVLSTVHTQHTLGTLVRLFDMGVPPYLAASALNGVLAQRLVHRVCDGCAEAYTPPGELQRALETRFGSLDAARFRKGRGCNRCHRTGTKGRLGVFELLMVDDDLRQLMAEGAAPSTLRNYVEQRGFYSLEEDAFRKACLGLIPPEEIVKLGFSLAAMLEESAATTGARERGAAVAPRG